jgi:hypothetical protein
MEDFEFLQIAAERLTSRATHPVDGCWVWTRGCIPEGYGCVHIDGSTRLAHRLAWMVAYGPIPAGMQICHHCDNRKCVRPDHLFLGTSADNLADMRRKGRHSRGEKVNTAKLTEAQVLAIRADTRHREVIAAEYGICRTHVNAIKRGRCWKHLP